MLRPTSKQRGLPPKKSFLRAERRCQFAFATAHWLSVSTADRAYGYKTLSQRFSELAEHAGMVDVLGLWGDRVHFAKNWDSVLAQAHTRVPAAVVLLRENATWGFAYPFVPQAVHMALPYGFFNLRSVDGFIRAISEAAGACCQLQGSKKHVLRMTHIERNETAST